MIGPSGGMCRQVGPTKDSAKFDIWMVCQRRVLLVADIPDTMNEPENEATSKETGPKMEKDRVLIIPLSLRT